MAVFLDRPAQKYTKRINPYSVSATIPSGLAKPVNALGVYLTPEGEWPAGSVGDVVLTGPNGIEQKFTFEGAFLWSRSPVRGAMFYTDDASPFPAGGYTMTFDPLQEVTCALQIVRA